MSVPRLHAPSEHGQILAVPAFDQAGEIISRNASAAKQWKNSAIGDIHYGVRPLVYSLATQYQREAGEPAVVPWTESDRAKPWIVAGHQPELFHPGVWFKNFVLHQLARRHGAIALNLVIDSDAAKPAFLNVPHGDKIARVPFDRASQDAPYEECAVLDEAMFASLPERIAPLAAAWGFEPMFAEFWNEVMRQAKRTNLIGERFAVARRAMERRFGIVPLEVPMSRICETNLFIYFLSLILNELESFQAIYNDAVHVYRQEHGIRSRNHPVPDLVNDGDWLETPFWAWRKGQARRHKLYVRKAPREWFMRFGDEQVSMRWEGVDAEVLEKLFAEGFKIRTRALTTTMFARMFLADLFIHGIGGGIYDALTDRIIERFFNVAAPGYMAVSATLLLPLPRYPDAAEQARLLQRKVRDLTYQPERFVVPNVEVDALLRAKKDWIKRNGTTHAERVERYEQIRAINSQLQPHVALELQRTLAALEQSKLQIKRHEVAAQRDYAFCLYPAEMLCEFFFQNPQESLRSS